MRWFAGEALSGAAGGTGADGQSPQPLDDTTNVTPDVAAARLSRLCFVVGQVALQHLVRHASVKMSITTGCCVEDSGSMRAGV